MRIGEAKNDARKRLAAAGCTFESVSARTIKFYDLARTSKIFVSVYGARAFHNDWQPVNQIVEQPGKGYVLTVFPEKP